MYSKVIDLRADKFAELTLNQFSTNKSALHKLARHLGIQLGESVLIRGRSGRVRGFARSKDDVCTVTLYEFDSARLSVQVGVYDHLRRSVSADEKSIVDAFRAELEERIKRQMQRRRQMRRKK